MFEMAFNWFSLGKGVIIIQQFTSDQEHVRGKVKKITSTLGAYEYGANNFYTDNKRGNLKGS